MLKKNDFCFTFDYELCLGKSSGTVENCLIKPTNILASVIQKHSVNSIFFVDALFLYRVRRQPNVAAQRDYEKISEQLLYLFELGIQIELHIHPHWLDAEYNELQNTWHFPSHRHYRLHSLNSKNPSSIWSKCGCIKYAKFELERIIHKADDSYKPTIFRAGGWCLEPFEQIADALSQNKIFLDSSTAHNFSLKSLSHDVNFNNLPQKASWSFDLDIRHENEEGEFKTMAIANHSISLLKYRAYKLWDIFLSKNKETKKVYGDGHAVQVSKSTKSVFAPFSLLLNTDTLSSKMMMRVSKSFAHKMKFRQGIDKIVTIGHPKFVSKYSANEIELFIEQLT